MPAPLPEYMISGSYRSDRLRGARPEGSPRRPTVAGCSVSASSSSIVFFNGSEVVLAATGVRLPILSCGLTWLYKCMILSIYSLASLEEDSLTWYSHSVFNMPFTRSAIAFSYGSPLSVMLMSMPCLRNSLTYSWQQY